MKYQKLTTTLKVIGQYFVAFSWRFSFWLCFIVIGCFVFLVATEIGLRSSVHLATRTALPELSVASVRGSWLTGVEFTEVKYVTASESIEIGQVKAKISLAKLIHGLLNFEHLYADKITLITSDIPSQPQSDIASMVSSEQLSLSLPELPKLTFTIKWDDLAIDNIIYNDVVIKNLNSHGLVTSNKRRLRVDLTHFRAVYGEESINATGQLFWQGSVLRAKQFSVTHLKDEFFLDGTLGKELVWRINWQNQDRSQFVIAKGKLKGKAEKLELISTIKANYQDDSIKISDLESSMTLSAKNNNHIRIKAKNIQHPSLNLTNVNLNSEGKIDQQHYQLTIGKNNIVESALEISGDWQLDFKALNHQRLEGKIDFILKNLLTADFNGDQSDKIQIKKGKLGGHILISGRFSNPKLQGEVNLSDAVMSIPQLGLTLKNIALNVMLNDVLSPDFTLKGELNSGKGQLSFDGRGKTNQEKLNGQFNFTGSDLTVINTQEFIVTATPSLTLNIRENNATLTGDITIPSARLQPKAITKVSNLSDDFIIKQKKPKDGSKPSQPQSKSTPLPLTVDVSVQSSKKIKIEYAGFKADLSGKLNLDKTPEQPLTAQGEVIIQNGTYQAHGQDLKIDNGRLLYQNDALTDPRLDVVATRKVSVMTKSSGIPGTGLFSNELVEQQSAPTIFDVGIRVTGKASKPKYKLFSNPSTLKPSEILAYLVLGHSLADAASDSTSILMQAASALKLTGKNQAGITQQVQSLLGLDKVGIQSVSTKDVGSDSFTPKTALNVGKKLSPRFYLDYTVGLFDPVNILKLRYQIKDGWMVQTETDQDNSGIDLFYNFESD